MAEPTELPLNGLNLYYVLQTGQNKELVQDSAPHWIEKLVKHGNQHVDIFNGLGARHETSSTSPLLQFLYLPIRLGHKFTGYGMKDDILTVWLATEGRSPKDRVIFMGSSRGGYSAQILAQIVHYFGYPTAGNSVNGKALQKRIRDGKPDSPKIPVCNEIRVYALDPVGTHWFRTPRTFFGLNSKTLPPGVRARVILMAGEGKPGFQPNIYATESDDLKQVWFDGVHGDAWGPSRHFERILAYLLYDMSSDDVAINEDLLSNMTNPLQRRGSLGKLLHWQQRYNNPLKSDDNQLRHESCQSIKPRDPNNNDDMSGICTGEDKMYNRIRTQQDSAM